MEPRVPRQSEWQSWTTRSSMTQRYCNRGKSSDIIRNPSSGNIKETDMSLSETHVDSLALAIANSGAWERMAHFLPLVWLLADGAPVSREQLATVLKRPVTEGTEALRQFEDIVYDDESRAVSAGISLQPTPYHFDVNGHLLYTWCP